MKKVLASLCLFCITLVSNHLTSAEPYDSIRLVPYEPYFLPNAWYVTDQLSNRSGTVFLDIGSDGCAAARYVAQNTSGVTSYVVHTWPHLGEFQKFLSNVAQENNGDKIVPIRARSDEAAYAFDIKADVIYLNTSNPGNLAADIRYWFSHLTSSGALVGDNWNLTNIEFVLAKAALDLGLKISTYGTFWVLENP